MLRCLFHPDIQIQARGEATPVRKDRRSTSIDPKTALTVIIYGKPELADTVGELLSRNHFFLQDPKWCTRVVRYVNPHRLSWPDERSMWTRVEDVPDVEILENVADAVDILSGFESGVDLPETDGPAALRTALLRSVSPLYRLNNSRHQKQALTFLLTRERGWAFDFMRKDLWSRVLNECRIMQ